MATLFEQSINHNTRCYACGSLVYAVEKKLTTNHVYHNRCFRCRICKRNLTGYSLNEDGDDIYCTNCYRKKQRGDCDSFEFHRAAAEKAQYVHYRHHPDQPLSSTNPRPPSLRDITRHPSLSLRQLERQFLSQQPKVTSKDDETINQRSFSMSHPLAINTSFSAPARGRNDSILSKDEPSPHFAAVFSPYPTIRTETTITPKVIPKPTTETTVSINYNNEQASNTTGTIQFRLNNSSINLTTVTSPSSNRKNIIVPDLNPTSGEQNENKFRFPDLNHLSSIRRRSSSARYARNPIRVD